MPSDVVQLGGEIRYSKKRLRRKWDQRFELRRLRIFGQRDKLKANRSKGGVRGGYKKEAAQRRIQGAGGDDGAFGADARQHPADRDVLMALVSMARNNGDFAAALRHARELLSLSGEKTLAELSAEFGVHPTMISNWKQELVKRARELFTRGSKASAVEDAQKVIDDLHRKIGQLQVERDFLAGQPAISQALRGG